MSHRYIASLLALLLASPALAAGVDIGWDNCLGEAGSASLKTFACNTNTGTESLWISFEVPVSTSGGLLEVAIEYRTRSAAPLPVWWDYQGTIGCRSNQLFVDKNPPQSTATCAQASTGVFVLDHTDYQYPTPDVGRIVIVGGSNSLIANQRYLACRFLLTHVKTFGCAGCDMPVSITVTAHVGGVFLTNPINNNTAYWQSLPTATRTSTWSALKQLYR